MLFECAGILFECAGVCLSVLVLFKCTGIDCNTLVFISWYLFEFTGIGVNLLELI
jgi:hypothetical protein